LLEAAVADAFEDATVRRHAATLLGELAHTSSEAVLAEALSDDDRGLRSVASKALALVFPEDTTRVNMARIRSAHDDVAEPAAGFLARHGDPSSLLERLPHIESAPVRARLRRGLVRRGALPTEAIAGLLAHETPGVRTDAAWLAGAAESAELATAAAKAAKTSAAQWDALAVGTDTVRRDAEAEAWRACLWAVRRGKADGGLAREVLANEKAPAAVLAEAVRLLETAEDRAGLPAVRGLLRHADARVRVAAARAIAALDPGQASAVALSSEVTDGRVAATLAHAALDKDAKAALASDSSRPTLLPKTLQTSRTDVLRSLATEGDGTARLTAIAALGRLGGDEAVSTLQGLLDDKGADEALRKAIFRALRRAQRRTATTQRQEHA
jgi:ParB family chromosome partitioning protein